MLSGSMRVDDAKDNMRQNAVFMGQCLVTDLCHRDVQIGALSAASVKRERNATRGAIRRNLCASEAV